MSRVIKPEIHAIDYLEEIVSYTKYFLNADCAETKSDSFIYIMHRWENAVSVFSKNQKIVNYDVKKIVIENRYIGFRINHIAVNHEKTHNIQVEYKDCVNLITGEIL